MPRRPPPPAADGENKERKLRRKKRKIRKTEKTGVEIFEVLNNKVEDGFREENDSENKESKLRKKKKKIGKPEKSGVENGKILNKEVEDRFREENDGENKESKLRKKKRKIGKTKKAGLENVKVLNQEVEDGFREENGVSKKAYNAKKDRLSSRKNEIFVEKKGEPAENIPYELSSGDEDCSRGMKKWIRDYHQARPGIKILQEKIDDFITAHEAAQEQARKEREALAAEGGWTVVTHHKGRKKTTDSETGISMGSVAQTVVLENMAKKKSKEVGPDFYRFNRREAQMNEIMALQSKFEQDKKRIQQLRAARKFRPY